MTLTTQESNRLYNQRRRTRWTTQKLNRGPRCVTILWPGCGDPERVTMALYKSWNPREIPAGTIVSIDGKGVEL